MSSGFCAPEIIKGLIFDRFIKNSVDDFRTHCTCITNGLSSAITKR